MSKVTPKQKDALKAQKSWGTQLRESFRDRVEGKRKKPAPAKRSSGHGITQQMKEVRREHPLPDPIVAHQGIPRRELRKRRTTHWRLRVPTEPRRRSQLEPYLKPRSDD
jgi:hypothetical protein